ncbi:uncharacterized protein RJT20DRAFT_15879 [Scheffersomyces xylosifermentans]|uniref:uncharacterized protein n=1 Tax=Scheffersomyces xylosifermentans TaxID=1304137 RepID=UPI00315D0943
MFFSNPLITSSLRRFSAKKASSVLTSRIANATRFPSQFRSLSFRFPATTAQVARARTAQQTRSSLSLLIGSTCSIILINGLANPIFNDAAAKLPFDQLQEVSFRQVPAPEKTYNTSRFGGRLDYEELTVGSVTGLFVGIIAGKLSSVFLFLSLASYFLVEFLESRHIINIPWTYIVKIGKNRIDIKEMVLNNPSFKISFALSFLIAAYNI